jgi:beta-phosphoglucomutase
MTRTQAIVFDMDGVLIDSEELHAYAKRISFAHAGIALSDADLRSYVGRSDAVMIDEVGARYGLTEGQRSAVRIATSATPRNRMTNLNRLGIANLFEVTVDLGDVSEPKPSPEIYLTVTSRLALPPSQCLVVEDSLTGALSAKRAGCRVSALTRTFAAHELLGVGADFIFEDFQIAKKVS